MFSFHFKAVQSFRHVPSKRDFHFSATPSLMLNKWEDTKIYKKEDEPVLFTLEEREIFFPKSMKEETCPNPVPAPVVPY